MKLVKGSLQAKRYMASIRAKKSINGLKEKDFYIEFLNKNKNFTKDKKYFDSYNQAIIWGKKNFERFNTDMIYNNSKKIGKVLGAVGDYAKFEIAVIKKLATLLKQPYKKTQETVNTSETLLNIISVNFDKKISVSETAKQLKAKLIEVNKKSPIASFIELLSKLPKKETQGKVQFPIKLPATVTIGNLLRKCKINGLPINFQGSFRGQGFYIVNQYDIYGNVVLELTDKKTNVKFGTITNNSKSDFIIDEFILWLSGKGVNFYTDKEIKEIHKQIKPLAVNLVQEVKLFNKGTKPTKFSKQVIKKAIVKKVKAQRLRPSKVSSKTSILKESNLIRSRLKDKKMIMPHGYQVKRSVLSGVNNLMETYKNKLLLLKQAQKNIKKEKDLLMRMYINAHNIAPLRYEIKQIETEIRQAKKTLK